MEICVKDTTFGGGVKWGCASINDGDVRQSIDATFRWWIRRAANHPGFSPAILPNPLVSTTTSCMNFSNRAGFKKYTGRGTFLKSSAAEDYSFGSSLSKERTYIAIFSASACVRSGCGVMGISPHTPLPPFLILSAR